MKLARLALLGSAIGVIGWSAWIVAARQDASSVVVAAAARGRSHPASSPARAAPVAPGAASGAEPLIPSRGALMPEPGGDSFGARQWLPPPPPPPLPPKSVAAPAPTPPPPALPPLPTLPYKLVGMLDAGGGSKPQVFLALQDRLLVASPGDVLDGGFRLDAVGPRELSFTHLASNVTLKLSVTGAPS